MCVTKLMHQLNAHKNALVNIFEFIVRCGLTHSHIHMHNRHREKKCREIYDSCADAERCFIKCVTSPAMCNIWHFYSDPHRF